MSDPMDLDRVAAEVRGRIHRDEQSAPTPWSIIESEWGEYSSWRILDAGLFTVGGMGAKADAQIAVIARNNLVPLLDDRDRLKAEVATLEGILSDLASESLQVQRIRELEARVKVLEEALRPFAEWADRLNGRFRSGRIG